MRICLTLIIVSLLLTGCQTAEIRSYSSASDVNSISKEEERLWSAAEHANEALVKSDAIYTNEEVTTYVQSVMDRLYPEFRGKIHVRLLNTPYLNAFALPSGDIYLNVGMLSRFENEAQLATVLAHEGAHFVHKHSLKQNRNAKGATTFAVGLSIVGIPIVGDLVALSSIFGYSQDLENEADNVAYERMLKAGYDGREATVTFEQLAAEVKALGVDEPFFFATHPKLQERISNFNKLNNKGEIGGIKGEQVFLDNTRDARLFSLSADLSLHRYKSIILNIGKNSEKLAALPEAGFYLGEAYRLRGNDGDPEKSFKMYQTTLVNAPTFAPTYRALGIYYLKNENYAESKLMLGRYLELAHDASDRAIIKQYFKRVSKEVVQP